MLARTCIVLVVFTVVVIASDYFELNKIIHKSDLLALNYSEVKLDLDSQRDSFSYNGPAPKKMEVLVNLQRKISYPESLPEHVFAVISNSFSNFKDLSMSKIEWRIESLESVVGQSQGDSMDRYSESNTENGMGGAPRISEESSHNQDKVIVKIEGEIRSFDGDYRRAINRVESLAMYLNAQADIDKVIVTKLPLDIDSGSKTSRLLSTQSTPVFSLDVALKKRAF